MYPSHYAPLLPLPYTSLHFTSLVDDFQYTLFFLIFFKLMSSITFLTLFFKVFGLQGRVPNTSAGNWFQS